MVVTVRFAPVVLGHEPDGAPLVVRKVIDVHECGQSRNKSVIFWRSD
jgi:hypothetical protein